MNHVAFLIPTIDRIGGAEQQVILLAKGLAARGWRVSIVALAGTGGGAAADLQSTGIAFHSLEMRKGLADPRGWLRLHTWIARNRPDILHAHLPHASLLARYSRIITPVRVCVDTIHSPATGSTARNIGYRWSALQPDAVSAVSHAAAGPWLRARLVCHQTLAIIPNGIDTDRFKRDDIVRAQMRHKLGLSGEFLWLAVGRLDPVKNHATLLQAFTRLSPDARLVVAGSGPFESALRSLTKNLCLNTHVTFLGFESNVLPWMQAADGFVLCSSWEGLPISLLEAGACELPAVITDIPGAREVLPDLLPSATAHVENSESLAAAMNALMRRPAVERRELGRLARASICARFRIEAVLTQWEGLYDALLKASPQPSRFGLRPAAWHTTLQFR